MEELAGWIAPAATMIAAMMTASNLGARFTGWGFVVFLVGSVAWCTVAVASGQQNLLWTNAFLTVVNIVGIWRWLGRQAKLEDGAAHALEASERRPAPTLFPVSNFDGAPIEDEEGTVFAHSVGATTECASGRISYVVVREGGAAGVGERYRAVPWRMIGVTDGKLRLTGGRRGYDALPEIDPAKWPARSPA